MKYILLFTQTHGKSTMKEIAMMGGYEKCYKTSIFILFISKAKNVNSEKHPQEIELQVISG